MPICIYPQDCTDFSTNGMGLLTPSSCWAYGDDGHFSELELTQPIDDTYRYAQLKQGCIIKAPVPARESPFYEAAEDITEGESVTVTRQLYRVRVRTHLRLRSGPGTSYKILGAYGNGTAVIRLDTSGSWYKVTVQKGGKTGWMHSSYLSYWKTTTEIVSQQKVVGQRVVQYSQATDQLWRIYHVEPDSEKGVVVAKAQHIFYDLQHNIVDDDYEPENKAANAILTEMWGKLMYVPEHSLHIAQGLTKKIDGGSYSYKNPVECMLDTETGILTQAGAQLVLDNFDVWVLPDSTRDCGVTIRRGKNLKGVKVPQDSSGIATRIVPRGKTKDGDPLYITDGTGPKRNGVDSAHIGEYTAPRVRMIDYDVRVVDKDPDNEKTFKTATAARAKLKELAQKEFSENGADLPTYGMKVDFELLQNTAEYADYAGLQAVFMGDTVTVRDSLIGLSARVRVTGFKFNCLTKQYAETTLGEINDLKQTVFNYNLPTGGINGSKIAIGSADGAILRNATLQYAKIAVATIDRLNANSIEAVTARIHELYAEQLITEELYVDLANIAKAQITTANIQAARITWADVLAAAIGTAQIIDTSITRAKIADAAIGTAQIDDLAVKTAKIDNAAVTTAKINDAAITTAKIALGAITTALIGTGAIGTAQIADGSITDAKIVSLNADVITAGTLSVSRLLIKGTGGLIYEINAQAGNLTPQQLTEEQYRNALSGTALVARSVTADKIAAQTITANEIAAGTITAAEINVADLFASNAVINRISAIAGKQYIQATVPGSPNLGDIWVDTANDYVTQVYDGTNWVDPATASLKNSYIEIMQDHIDIVSGGKVNVKSGGAFNVDSGQVNMRTSEFRLQITEAGNEENVLMEMSADGSGFDNLYADRIVSGSIVAMYDGPAALTVDPDQVGDGETVFPTLREAVDTLNGHCLAYDVVIHWTAGAAATLYETEPISLRSIIGPYTLTINGPSSSVVQGYMEVVACTAQILFQDLSLREIRPMDGSSRNDHLIRVSRCAGVTFDGCTLDGNDVTATLIQADASQLELDGCGAYNAENGLCQTSGTAQIVDCKGVLTTALQIEKSICFCAGTVPYGSRTKLQNGQIFDSGVTTDNGSAAPPVSPITTSTFTAATVASYRSNWSTVNSDGDCMQGAYSANGYSSSVRWWYGCLWFDLSSLAGKTVSAATLKIKRKTGSGSAGATNLNLCATTKAAASGGAPAVTRTFGSIGSIGRNETKKFSVPAAAIQGIIDGTYTALMLYETPYNFGSANWSRHYSRMCGTNTSTPPVLEVTYS